MADFIKMQGTGNDFVIVDITKSETPLEKAKIRFSSEDLSQLAIKICQRRMSIGADGLVILSSGPQKNQLEWKFFNSDGSHAEMCGNAARCVALYAISHLNLGPLVEIHTTAGVIRGQRGAHDHPKITMTPVTGFKEKQVIHLGDQSVEFDYLNTGVPHALHSRNFEVSENFRQQFSLLRNHSNFQPQEPTSQIVKVIDDYHVRSASFERGVESFTLACGTGAVAAAFLHLNRIDKAYGTVRYLFPVAIAMLKLVKKVFI
ncbi:MAG: diaminopimelate epimerase [Bdellovibrionales bacterium]